MKLLNTSRSKRGFTLIEVLIVLGIFILLAVSGLFMTLDAYRRYTFRSERDTIVSLLERARSEAMSNTDQTPHGFCFSNLDNEYILFEGINCEDVNIKKEITPALSDITLSGLPDTGVTFSPLSGQTNWSGEITLTQGPNQTVININSEGLIEW